MYEKIWKYNFRGGQNILQTHFSIWQILDRWFNGNSVIVICIFNYLSDYRRYDTYDSSISNIILTDLKTSQTKFIEIHVKWTLKLVQQRIKL